MPINLYRAYGLAVACNRTLPELSAAAPAALPDVEINWGGARTLRETPGYHSGLIDSLEPDEHFALTSDAGAFTLWFEDVGSFRVSLDGTRIEYGPTPSAEPAASRHILLDHVLPRALARRGDLILHGSAVVLNGAAVAFLGRSGDGKSTLACALGQQGLPRLSDDCLRVKTDVAGPIVVASYPGVRLWPGHASEFLEEGHEVSSLGASFDKRRYAPSGEAAPATEARLSIWYDIRSTGDDASAVVIEPLRRREALLASVECSFSLDAGDEASHAEHLSTLTDSPLLRCGYSLRYPRTLARLPEVLQEIRAHAAAQAI